MNLLFELANNFFISINIYKRNYYRLCQ